MEIKVTVRDKIAVGDGTRIVCRNSDYVVRFDLDAEWKQFITRTMIVVNSDKTYSEYVFTGDTVELPVIDNQTGISIGLYAGDLHTSTPAYFDCIKSVRDGLGEHEAPSEDVYNQLVQLVENGAVKGEKGDKSYIHIAYANSEDGETDFTTSPVSDKVYTYLGQYSDYTLEDSTVPSEYVWSKLSEEAARIQEVTTLAEDVNELKGDLSNIAELPDTTNYIDISVDNMIVVDTSVIPEVSVSGNTVTLTQPSRSNVKVAFPITVDSTDTETVYDIQVKSSVVLNNIARILITVDTTVGNQGTTITPVLSTEDYSVWNASGTFGGYAKQKYLYIMMPYNVPSSTFEISVKKKNVTENIHVKKEAIVNIGFYNFDDEMKEKMMNVDYLVNRFGGHDSSEKSLVILNFEQNCDDWYADRQAILEQYGFKGSFALNGPLTTQEQISRLHNLVNNGHDIAIYNGSTNGRPDDVNDTSKQAEWDSYIEYIVNIAKNYGIHNPVAYHCKYNLLGTALYNSLLKYGFKIARCSNASDFGFDDNDSDKCIKTFDRIMTVANTNSFSSDSNGSTPHIWFINKAIQNGWDIAFFGHGMEDVDINTDLSDPVHFKKFILVDICEHLKQCIENGTVEVVTWAEYYKIRSGN